MARIGFAVVVIAYPVIVYIGLEHFDTRIVALLIIGLAATRLFLVRSSTVLPAALPQGKLVVYGLLFFGILTLMSNVATLLRYYPVVMNVLMFGLFFGSLLRPPTVIETIARIGTPDLPEAGVRYTRKVTIVWCGFFAFNGSMALYTSIGSSLELWAAYNSVISYSIMGILFAGEYLIRRVVQRRNGAQAGAERWR